MRFSQDLITVLLSIILTMSVLSLQFKPYDGVTQLARQSKENMNHVALEVQKAPTCQKGALCDSRQRQMEEDVAYSARSHFIKSLEIQNFYNIFYSVCKDISEGCLSPVSDSLTIHNKVIFNIYVLFN